MSRREMTELICWIIMLVCNAMHMHHIGKLQELIEEQDSVIRLQWDVIWKYKEIIGKYIEEKEKE